MDNQRLLEELLALLEQNSVEIRRESLGGSGGGLCSVKGQQLFFVDTMAPLREVASMAAVAVSAIVNTADIYIRPEIRDFIESHS